MINEVITKETFFSLQQTMTKGLAYDGEPVRLVELENSQGMRLVLMDIGATWLSCQVPLTNGETREVLLGLDTIEKFNDHASFMGVIVGRYANRIKKGQFCIKGQSYQVSTNQSGNCLHGGKNGFDKRRWAILVATKKSVTFELISEDGDQGFPGKLTVLVTYSLTDKGRVEIKYQATTDKATPVNLTNHAYFNLMGAEIGEDCLSHQLQINADFYQPIDENGLPNAALSPVVGTNFDFTKPRLIKSDFIEDAALKAAKGYDHSFWFGTKKRDLEKPVATLISPDKKLKLDVITDKPAMQLYTGNWLSGTPCRLNGQYQAYAGVALETQFLPDSPNGVRYPLGEENLNSEFLDEVKVITEPNEVYTSTTSYVFKAL